MPFFKLQCCYLGVRKQQFFKDKEQVEYHKFRVESPEKLPRQFFHPTTKLGKGEPVSRNFEGTRVYCWLFISSNLVKKANLAFKKDQEYQFLMKLGEPKTADFTIYYEAPPPPYEYEKHSMVLKTKQYFENTVQKIGLWGNDKYFYEVNKKENPPPNHSNPNQPNNQNLWVKITLICLPFLILALFVLWLTKWASKKKS